MNAVNALLPAGHKLSIYSLEQSDVESPAGPSTDVANPTADDVLFEKKCLTGSAVPGLCAAAQVANPAVQYGYVAGSCGASNLYDMQHFDYGYPQMYNLYHSWSTAKSSPLGLPPEAFSGGSPDPSVTYTLIDAIPGYKKSSFPDGTVFVPNYFQDMNVNDDLTTIYESKVFQGSDGGPNPQVAAQVLAELIVAKYGNTNVPFPCGAEGSRATTYFTLSGEPEFFGSPGWTLPKLVAFYQALVADLKTAGVPASVADQIPFAIWGFDTMNLSGGGGS